jgi:hypothetical protein
MKSIEPIYKDAFDLWKGNIPQLSKHLWISGEILETDRGQHVGESR